MESPPSSFDLSPYKKRAFSQKIYANEAKIILEVLSARTLTIVLVITYTVFIAGLAYDLDTVTKGYLNQEHIVDCHYTLSSSCYGNVTQLTNVVSLELTVSQRNLSHVWAIASHVNSSSRTSENGMKYKDSSLNNKDDEFIYVGYNVYLWACYQSNGCGNKFSTRVTDNSDTSWHQVYISTQSQNPQIMKFVREEAVKDDAVSWMVFDSIFQNQEALPTKGTVKSYYVQLQYVDNPFNLFVPATTTSAPHHSVTYEMSFVTRPQVTLGSSVLLIILIILTVWVAGAYLQVLLHYQKKRKWLREQYWVLLYLFALFCYLNPVYSIIMLYGDHQKDNISMTAICAAYVFDNFGQSLLFVIWMMFADSISRKKVSAIKFYGPKIFFGAAIFYVSMVILAFQFPSLNGELRSPVSSSNNWSESSKNMYIAFNLSYLILLWIWAGWWIWTLVHTYKILQRLPYMSTRYLQLSFRFFCLQASLVTFFYLIQYSYVMYFVTSQRSLRDPMGLSDAVSSLNRDEQDLFGKMFFLFVYALLLAFLFLPAEISSENELVKMFAATYVIREMEMKTVTRLRRERMKTLHFNPLLLTNFTNFKANVFCIDIAIALAGISFEAYYDPDGMFTPNGMHHKCMELERFGYVLIDTMYHEDHDTFCFIARHVKQKRIVVSFRGTSSKKHWNANLNYAQKEVNFYALPPLGPVNVSSLIASSPHAAAVLSTTPYAAAAGNDKGNSNSNNNSNNNNSNLASTNQDNNYLHAGESSPYFEHINSEFPPDVEVDDDDESSDEEETTDNEGNVISTKKSTKKKDEPTASRDFSFLSPMKALSATAAMLSPSPHHARQQSQHQPSTPYYNNNNNANATPSASTASPSSPQSPPSPSSSSSTNAWNSAMGFVFQKASETPGLKAMVNPSVHSGFWESYSVVREFVHGVLRRELALESSQVYFTGHSLGGALATLACLDVSIHTIPRMNALLRCKRDISRAAAAAAAASASASEQTAHTPTHEILRSSKAPSSPQSPQGEARLSATSLSKNATSNTTSQPNNFRKIKVSLYTFGSPKVGNRNFKQLFNKIVPDTFRTCVDGDIVTAVPPRSSGYVHIGTEILLDGNESGSIIVDPSFVERRLHTQTKSSVTAHSMLGYRKALDAVKEVAKILDSGLGKIDNTRLALHIGENRTQRREWLPQHSDKMSVDYERSHSSLSETGTGYGNGTGMGSGHGAGKPVVSFEMDNLEDGVAVKSDTKSDPSFITSPTRRLSPHDWNLQEQQQQQQQPRRGSKESNPRRSSDMDANPSNSYRLRDSVSHRDDSTADDIHFASEVAINVDFMEDLLHRNTPITHRLSSVFKSPSILRPGNAIRSKSILPVFKEIALTNPLGDGERKAADARASYPNSENANHMDAGSGRESDKRQKSAEVVFVQNPLKE